MALQIFVYLCMIRSIIGAESASEFNVYKELTRSYDRNIRPIHNTSLHTYVSVQMTYFTLLNIDQPAETVRFLTEVVLDAGSIPAEGDPHPTKVLIPLWVGDLVAAMLRIYRRQALATGRPILTSRINHGPKVASRQRARGADPATLRDNRLADTAKATWHDEIVKWNRTAYSDIDLVVIPASLLWKPDIVVTTSLKTDYMLPEEERFVKVSGDGTVRSETPCIITNQCVLDIQNFPYDIQECNITFESWVYDSSKIDLK
uniref:Neurotransmitter-gated ion-channel ligand-binding domain-containing protein n=1 Tax=Plectus sambesii TaxID=2011161 RepID=A0A914WR57_9BILA